MTLIETPREKALRLWEAAGYARAAYYDVADADSNDVAAAARNADADAASDAAAAYNDAVGAVYDAVYAHAAYAAYEAGHARYRREHP